MRKKNKIANAVEAAAIVEDGKLENVVGGGIPDGHNHQDSDSKLQQVKYGGKAWFAIGSESNKDSNYPSPKIGWGKEEPNPKPFESDDGTTSTIIK